MNKALVYTIIGVILAIVIASFLVNALFSVIYLLVRIIIVGAVAVLVYFALRGLFARWTRE